MWINSATLKGMTEPISLPPGAAYAIIAFLLSLLPAGLFIWLWYLRRNDRPVPTRTVGYAFLAGMGLVAPAFWLERTASDMWYEYWPATAHYFAGAVLPLQNIRDVLWPAFATFIIVATVEEGLRYLLLRWWYRRSRVVDQVFDGLVIGIAAGIGFATLENTLYFLNLFSEGSVDTLVFVFFLRFMISTMAHISFGGIMGALMARAVFQIYRQRRRQLYAMAFFVSWFAHGLYNLLLGLNLTVYAVLVLLPPLLVLLNWAGRRDFFAMARKNGRVLVRQKAPVTEQARVMKKFFKQFDSPWNKEAPWLRERRVRYTLIRDLED